MIEFIQFFFSPSTNTIFSTLENEIDFDESVIIFACIFLSFLTFAASITTVILSFIFGENVKLFNNLL